ncbi:WD40-repeat-containing domain protein [Mycena rosella]|uniref:WD40-repeat-containing domain protein n=1 Tax=Mycena rosella TaxID=1033263 RepID=A0AAD7H0S0_MYCRO|nr:WD40-repeat-containing domain protein [Mycena rosella]
MTLLQSEMIVLLLESIECLQCRILFQSGKDGLEVERVDLDQLASLPDDKDRIPGAPTQIVIAKSIKADILNHLIHLRSFTKEDVFIVHCLPQSVFCVRPPTRCSSTLSGCASPILCVSFSPTGNFLAMGSGDITAWLWNLDTETPLHMLSGHKRWVLCVEWEAMEHRLATGGHDGHVRIWDPKTGKPFGDVLKGHSKWITLLCWEPIHLYKLLQKSLCPPVGILLEGRDRPINVVKWGGIGNSVLYTASSDHTLRIWDAKVGRQLHILKDHAHWVTTLVLNTNFVLCTGPFDHMGKKAVRTYTSKLVRVTTSLASLQNCSPHHTISDEEAQKLVLERYTAVLNTTPELLISGSDNHTLFLWSPFPTGSTTVSTAVIQQVSYQPWNHPFLRVLQEFENTYKLREPPVR